MCRSVGRDPVGDDSVRQEPWRDHQVPGAACPQAIRGVGDAGLRSRRESDFGARPPGPRAQDVRHARCPRVGGLVRRADRDDEHTEAAGFGGHPDLGQPLPQHRQQSGIFAEHLGLFDAGARLLDHLGDVDPRVIGVGQQERHHDPGGTTSKHVAQIRAGLFEKCGTDVEPGPQPADAAGHRMRDRRRPGVDAAVGRQGTSVTTRAARIPSWTGPPSGRCADRRPRPAWPCTARSRSTDSPRRQGD